MKRIIPYVVILLIFICLLTSCGKRDLPAYIPPSGISWSSVLDHTVDIVAISDPVQTWERSLHFSSSAVTGKVMLANLAPEIMGDMDHGFFLDVTEGAAFVDATLAEVHGKGMISWIWSANPAGIIRVFIDDDTTPTIEMPFKDFMEGSFLPVAYPFSALTANGYNLHFPILHNSYCKVVVRMPQKKDLATLYYQVAWNSVDPAQIVNRFSLDDVSKGAAKLGELAKSLLQPYELVNANEFTSIDISPGQSVDIFTSPKEGTITEIALQSDSRDEMSRLQFVAYWDGSTQPSVDCPLYLFAGTSERMENVSSFPTRVKGTTTVIRWPMPYKTARLVMHNNSTDSVHLQYGIRTITRSIPSRFGGEHRMHAALWTDRHNIITLANISGYGRIVACNIQVKSMTDKWWGEGDQLIYLDSLTTPVWQGTGTEDYFGFAWCSKTSFDHPFRGQSSVRYENGKGRTSAMHRYHFLNQLPFLHLASFQTEAWGLSDGFMDYESLVLFYSNEGAQQSVPGYPPQGVGSPEP